MGTGSFINMIQSVTFLAADLQVRLATGVFKDEILLLSDEQRNHMKRTRDAMCVQYMDCQATRTAWWYVSTTEKSRNDRLLPSFYKLLRERPTAFLHAWGAMEPGTISSSGPGPPRTFGT